MSTVPWITILIIVPLAAAAILWFVPGLHRYARPYGILASLVTLAVGIVAATGFDYTAGGSYQFVQEARWIPQIGVSYAVGLNGLGLVMVLLALVLVPICLAADWNAVGPDAEDTDRRRTVFVVLVLVLTAMMVMIFAARDLFLFYVVFELMLVPVYFLIGMFGGPRRRHAAVKFLIYSLAGGLVMLAGVVIVYFYGPGGERGFMIDALAQNTADTAAGRWLFLAFFVGFMVKAPMWPVHTWLPDVAAEATPGTSTLLVGVLDKVGTFGMLAICLPLFPEAARWFGPAIVLVAIVSLLYGALVAMRQKDLMRFVSFTSISHFGFMVMGIFIGTEVAMTGAMFYMLAHGLSIAGLFLLSGFLIERSQGSRNPLVDGWGGMQRVTPILAGTFLTVGLASVALPGLSGFIGEYLVLIGTFGHSIAAGAVATLAVVLAALYFLLVYQKIFTGTPRAELTQARGAGALRDLTARERWVVGPLILAMLVLGFFPGPVLDMLTPISQVLAFGGLQ